MAGEQNGAEEKQSGKKKAGDDEEEDYMSATFIKTSSARTMLKRKLDMFEEEDEEEFVSASLFSTVHQSGQQAEPFSNLDYEEEEEAEKEGRETGGDGDEEEDYMSANFLASFKDVKPGIRSTANYQRMLRMGANRDAAEESNAKAPKKMKKGELEKHRLNEGLSRPIDESSKGYELLAKMGFKPGMSLGKPRTEESEVRDTRIKEPIPIQTQFTSTRIGLGRGEEEKTRQRERCELHLKEMAKRAHMEEALAEDFRTRKRGRASLRQLIGDIRKCRKVCEELDVRKGFGTPPCEWFWPSYSDGCHDEEEDGEGAMIGMKPASATSSSDPFGLVKASSKFVYSNGTEAPSNPDFKHMSEEELQERLESIVTHLRLVHVYCTWCGCAYDSLADLEAYCPGRLRQDHDE